MNTLDFNEKLAKYADVVVRVGLNLRKGQRLMVRAGIEEAPFVREIVTQAYRAGARYVDVMLVDERLKRIRFEHASPDSLTEVPDWPLRRSLEYYERADASLSIYSDDPDLLDGIDADLIAGYDKAWAKKSEPLTKYIMGNALNWCLVSTATPAWARKVFPGIPVEQAQEKLWEAIFETCRIDLDDPVAAWKDHIATLLKRAAYLNARRYAALHYTAPGTDLTIGLPEGHRWISGQEQAENGIEFTANLPTEEIFTLPHRDRVDGRVTASKPFAYNGVLIEGFTITFEAGKVTGVRAARGEATLRKLIETDDGAARLGEASLVPASSPINRRDHLFYNTLFDENAACHIALGEAYRSCLEGGIAMSEEAFQAHGGNKSLIHEDFMIGSEEMDIDGLLADGAPEPVMRKGEWAFSV
jgi:aminopeptidase